MANLTTQTKDTANISRSTTRKRKSYDMLEHAKPSVTTRYRVKGNLVNDVFIKDVPTLLRKEEIQLGMVQWSSDAVMMDAPIKPRKEEYVLDMVQWSKRADMKDVPIMLSMEECVSDMVQSGRNAVTKDATT